MKQSCHLVLLALLSLTLSFEVSADNERTTYSKIYEKIDGALACFRRFNGTHQIGCASKSLNGDTGVLHVVNDTESLDWVTSSGPHSPYIVVMNPKNFIPEYMMKFQSSDRIAGVLLMDVVAPQKVDHFSSELECPNRGFGFFNKTSADQGFCPKWNKGTGMLYENWDFPVFFVHDPEDAQFILKCHDDFNTPVDGVAREWPLCAAQLQSFMLGAVDTPTCLRRSKIFSMTPGSSKVCDPLGSFNLYAPLVPVNQSNQYSSKSVIIIGARLDASSMFDKIAPGAGSAATGIATLLTVLKHLSTLKEELLKSKTVENIYFILFQGEAFDYIGSSKIVYDMVQGKFPYNIDANSTVDPAILRLENIKYFIEIGQVANVDSYYLHRNWHTSESSKKETASLVNDFVKNSDVNVTFVSAPINDDLGLPPSSFQSFLRMNPDVPGIVITNHKEEFTNPFYNSVLDTGKNLGYTYKSNDTGSIQKKLSSLAAAIANSVWKLTGVNATKFEPDTETVDELLNCYLTTSQCKIFQNVTSKTLDPLPHQLYVGVRVQQNPITVLSRSVMIYYQGTNVSKTEEECKEDEEKSYFDYYWINGTCFETTVNISEALSPAFTIENYDWKNANYSTWSESVWQKLQVRVFLKPSLQHELLTLCFGIALFVVSFVVVGWANHKSDVIFSSRIES